MKTKDYKLSDLKHKLVSMKQNGKKDAIWALTEDQVQYLTALGYVVKPYLYRIQTKSFHSIRKIESSIIKEIHYKYKSRKYFYVRKLSKQECKILDENGVKYTEYKYRIILNNSNN